MPARPRKPKDKAKLKMPFKSLRDGLSPDSGINISIRWGLNMAIKELLKDLNLRPFQRLPGNRTTLFEALDKPVLKPLPSAAYEFRHS